MKEKLIDFNKSVYELCNEHPELLELLAQVGFQDITKPGMLTTVGRFMTLPKGAAIKKIDLENLKHILIEHGYQVR